MESKVAAKDLKKAIGRVGVTQTWAARKLGVSGPYLNRVIAGAVTPSSELTGRIGALTKALNESGLVATG